MPDSHWCHLNLCLSNNEEDIDVFLSKTLHTENSLPEAKMRARKSPTYLENHNFGPSMREASLSGHILEIENIFVLLNTSSIKGVMVENM